MIYIILIGGYKKKKNMKEIQKLPVEHYLQLIKNNEHFSFSRFGDGEVLCMFHEDWFAKGNHRWNTDGCYYLEEIVEPMKQIFKNQYDYYHCFLDCSFDLEGETFKKFLDETCPNMQFYHGEVWQSLAFSGKIADLTTVLSEKNPCFIGGKHIENVKYIDGIQNFDFIEVPVKDSFKEFDKIFNSILDKHKNGKRMFCFSAGYTTKILIDQLFPLIGKDSFMIDFGSVFDPFCGNLSRSGHVEAGFKHFQPYTKMKLL